MWYKFEMDDKISKHGKVLLLAYDQGFEHGPVDFDETNVDPQKVFDIARDAGVYTGAIMHDGLVGKYEITVPKIIKLNGKTAFHKGEEAVSLQLTSVAEAVKLGAVGVGYTVYVGSEYEVQMMQEFARITDEAHAAGLVAIMWAYPRGKHVEGKENDTETIAYAARLGLEMGADYVKVSYCDKFDWVVKSAGKTRVLVQGGSKKEETVLLSEMQGAMQAGAAGVAIGRNIWQSQDPIGLSKKIAGIVFA